MRIVSTNPCTDAILKEITDPVRIAAISRYSQDPRATSVPLGWARRYTAVSDSAEDVLAMRPDLVIASTYAPPQTVLALRRLGVRVLQFDAPDTVEQSMAQIVQIAAHVGRREQGRALIARIEAAVRQASAPVEKNAPKALVWQENGLVLGRESLTGDLLARTGFGSAAFDLGIARWGMVPLEDMLMYPPQIVMTGREAIDAGSGSGGTRLLTHPALLKVRNRISIAHLPAHLLRCGGPSIIPTVQRLSAMRAQWREAHGS